MSVKLAGFLRTTLPLAMDVLDQCDNDTYHAVWLPDHMVSFWPDSIWTPEFTDLALSSPSPHRHLEAGVAAATAVLTRTCPWRPA
jgi:phthiodiolone/phenolphthiodiolone dimycocerosates ketoreductase